MATDPAAAVAAAMMQGMRLPLALTKKQMKSEMSVQNHSNGNGRISPAQEEKEGETMWLLFVVKLLKILIPIYQFCIALCNTYTF